MINQQLVDYIKQQLAAGVQKDTVRKALADAGWAAADIDDSMKAAEPAATAGPAAAVGAMGAAATTQASTINPVVAMGGSDAGPRSDAARTGVGDKFFSQTASMPQGRSLVDDVDDGTPSARKFVIAMIAMGAVILLLIGALAFMYFNMSGQLRAAEEAGGGNSTQLSALQQQVAQVTKEKEELGSQVQSLTTDNQSLNAELSFFAAAASATSTAPVSATIKGTLTGNATTSFVLLTSHNIRITILNSKDVKVTETLTPLANGTTVVTLTGTHAPAAPNLTVTAVNGTTL